VNATGTVLGDLWPALPLADPAVDEIVRLASDYQADKQLLVDRVQHNLRELSSAEAACLVHSYPAAIEIARESGIACEMARYAGFLNPEAHGLTPYATIVDRLQGGSELLVVDGAGLIGGPPCGIVIGRCEKVEEISKHSYANIAAPDVLTLAALAATLSIYEAGELVIHRIPVWQLLTAPLENLEQRCQRMAILIGESERVASAAPTRCDSAWCDSQESKLSGPSWAIVVRPTAEAFDGVVTSLHEAAPQVVARVQHEEIWLDLRAVFPRWDQHLIAAVG
jgi:L-seryl-tRNA(Ser) seleniumtransferase